VHLQWRIVAAVRPVFSKRPNPQTTKNLILTISVRALYLSTLDDDRHIALTFSQDLPLAKELARSAIVIRIIPLIKSPGATKTLPFFLDSRHGIYVAFFCSMQFGYNNERLSTVMTIVSQFTTTTSTRPSQFATTLHHSNNIQPTL
jgi:hypothetical protein